jgi:uncharacterized membrane protein YkvA (DUF1232 family)
VLAARAGGHAHPVPDWLLIAAAAMVALYVALIAALLVLGRKQDARAWAGFIPDCIVLFKRLLSDPRLSRRRKLLIAVLVAYLVLPFDLVPDFIPIAGQLDDAIIVAFVLRTVLRGAGPAIVREHWPGPPNSLAVMLRLAGETDDAAGR